MIEIRIADPADPQQGKAIVELLNQYAMHPMGGGQPLSEYTRNHLVESLCTRQDYIAILAYDAERPVGLCNCFEGFSTFASKPLLNIHDVFVEEEYRSQGIAQSMMQKAEQIARENGCCKITLEVLNNNEKAKASYRASGYTPYELNELYGQAEFWQKHLD
jgi:GNAT superfamily N-acetyltransferase